jgi:regulator of RNase E activity RraA
VVVVPAANVEKVLAAAETTDAKERKIAERIKAGESTIDILNFRDLVYPKSQ